MTRPRLRYGQCWEDAGSLLQALDPRPGALILSIASGGENSLALLIRPGVQVLAIDRSAAQIAALELKVSAFRHLDHGEMLQLLGAHPASRADRLSLYRRCRAELSTASLTFWDGDPSWLGCGVLAAARFERYLALFRRLVLPLVHAAPRRGEALRPRPAHERALWYDTHWDNHRWRALFRLFFCRLSLGGLGTDPDSVRFGDGSQAAMLLGELRRVMVEQDPACNPHLHWLLQGRYGQALPLALRPEHYGPIRSRLDQLHCQTLSLQQWLEGAERRPVDGINLSNLLEYIEPAAAGELLEALHRRASPGARLLLWNRLAQRDSSLAAPGLWQPLDSLARQLHHTSQVPFYRRLVVAQALPHRVSAVPPPQPATDSVRHPPPATSGPQPLSPGCKALTGKGA